MGVGPKHLNELVSPATRVRALPADLSGITPFTPYISDTKMEEGTKKRERMVEIENIQF